MKMEQVENDATAVTPTEKDTVTPAEPKDRKFGCEYCGRAFVRGEHLRRHVITHTGDKPFQCSYCQDSFSRSDILKRHLAKCRQATSGNQVSLSKLLETLTPNAPARRACDRCAHLKVRCDFEEPCSRCSKSKVDCSYKRLHTQLQDRIARLSAESNGIRKPKSGRSKSGAGGEENNQKIKKRRGNSSFSFPSPSHFKSANYYDRQPDFPTPSEAFEMQQQAAAANGMSQSYSTASPLQALVDVSDATLLDELAAAAGSSTTNLHLNRSMSSSFPPNHHQHSHAADEFGAHASPGFEHNSMLNMSQPESSTFAHDMSYLSVADNPGYALPYDAAWSFFIGDSPSVDTPFDQGSSNTAMHFPQSPLMSAPPAPPLPLAPPTATSTSLPASRSEREMVDAGFQATFDQPTREPSPEPLVHRHPSASRSIQVNNHTHYHVDPDNLSFFQVDPLGSKVEYILLTVYGTTQSEVLAEHGMEWFTSANVAKYIMLCSRRGARHTPCVHFPSFDISSVHISLLIVMVFIGKAYDEQDRLTAKRIQSCIDMFLSVHNKELREASAAKVTDDSTSDNELQMLQAEFLLTVLLTWDGNKAQRDKARRDYGTIVDKAKRAGLMKCEENFGDITTVDQWKSWARYQARIRSMYNIYLMDCAFVIFFNAPPTVDMDQIKVELPCDDALWDAPNVRAFSELWKNRTPCVRFDVGLNALIERDGRFDDLNINIYGKFILLHALHVQIWLRLEQPHTSFSQSDMTAFHRQINFALSKFRRAWDADLVPIQSDPQRAREWARMGFYRNALEYWWLAKLYLARPRLEGWGHRCNDDSTLPEVKRMLRNVRIWVHRGERLDGLRKEEVAGLREDLRWVVPGLQGMAA